MIDQSRSTLHGCMMVFLVHLISRVGKLTNHALGPCLPNIFGDVQRPTLEKPKALTIKSNQVSVNCSRLVPCKTASTHAPYNIDISSEPVEKYSNSLLLCRRSKGSS